MVHRPVITAEHGGHEVPAPYRHLFEGHQEMLRSHRGWDAGSLELAEALAERLGAPLVASTVSRLVVDLNRSESHPRVFSHLTRGLDRAAKDELLATYYRPHRRRVMELVERAIAASGCAVHLGIHSFTPVLDGRHRTTDVGLLYDPARPGERHWCGDLAKALRRERPDLTIHRNRPYLGVSDGLTTALRRRFPPEQYFGIEIEVNQRHVSGEPAAWRTLQGDLCHVMAAAFRGEAR